jgi:hypothetical protein
MKSVMAIAKSAPSGKGVVSWENGQLSGDAAIIDAAQAVEQVAPIAMAQMADVDWNDANSVGEALRIGAERVYGSPVEVMVASNERPVTVEASSASAGDSEPIY